MRRKREEEEEGKTTRQLAKGEGGGRERPKEKVTRQSEAKALWRGASECRDGRAGKVDTRRRGCECDFFYMY